MTVSGRVSSVRRLAGRLCDVKVRCVSECRCGITETRVVECRNRSRISLYDVAVSG
jgi:hypothetical protein